MRRFFSSGTDLYKHLSPAVARNSEWVIKSGRGSWLFLDNGQKVLDFACGFGVTNLGHCHPKVVKAIQDQAAKVHHVQVGIAYHEPGRELMSRLLKIVPKKLDGFFFVSSGSEAVENAVKVARHFTKKPNIICFQGGYHGRTYGTMALTTSKYVYRSHFGPVMPGVFVAPYPYKSQLPEFKSVSPTDYCIDQLELVLKQQTLPSETAAVIVEPLLGEGGYVPPPPDFLKRVQEVCNKHNILLILDEVQTGFGRTGKMFALEHYGVEPDILVFAKGVANGLPLSGIAANLNLYKPLPRGSLGGTYSGNAVCMAAGAAVCDVFKEENVLQNCVERGKQLRAGLEHLKTKYPLVDIRGLGLMIGVEFDPKLKDISMKVSANCFKEGMMLLNTSVFETVRFIPPLTVTKEEVEHGLAIFEKAVQKALESYK